MPASHELAVWMYDSRVAVITERRSRKVALQYTDEARARWANGQPVLSVSMPLSPSGVYPPAVTTPFLEGLLPEGDARSSIESRFGVARGDTFGLLAEIGIDCAGAVTFQPMDSPAPRSESAVEPISDEEVIAEIGRLGTYPLGVTDEVRLSLAGLQEKLLLTRTTDGRWARPTGSTPSTHILKPQDERYPSMVANEALCLRIARHLGLTSVDVEIFDADGRPVLVVARYDRRIDDEGVVTRIHQEDFCQALAISTESDGRKYEEGGGPSLLQIAEMLDAFAHQGLGELVRLAEVVTFNVAIGNADAHGKNLSLLHHPDGSVKLAPLYDVMSTTHYATVATRAGRTPVSTALAMSIDALRDVNDVTVDAITGEAGRWPLAEAYARPAVEDLLGRFAGALDAAVAETPAAPGALIERVSGRVRAMREGLRVGAGDESATRVG